LIVDSSWSEPLGKETVVFVPVGRRGGIARILNPTPLESGQTISASFDFSKAHLFAVEGGQSIGAIGRLRWRASNGSTFD